MSKTYNMDAMVPDSAATAFSMYSGVKSNTFTMGYDTNVKVSQSAGFPSSDDSYFLNQLFAVFNIPRTSPLPPPPSSLSPSPLRRNVNSAVICLLTRLSPA